MTTDLTADLTDTACPACGEKKLRIEQRLAVRDIGTFSLAGAQMKFSASRVPWLVCDGCGVEAKGSPA